MALLWVLISVVPVTRSSILTSSPENYPPTTTSLHDDANKTICNSISVRRRKLAALDGQAGAIATSMCFLPAGGVIPGPVDCPGGEIQLLGEYVNMGIHQAGSFGTTAALNSTYYTYTPSLGLIVDYDRNGFATSTPGFSGDYFQVGTPVEGIYFCFEKLYLRYFIPTHTACCIKLPKIICVESY